MNIDNTPPKGTYDWFPEEFAKRKYIFDTWRKVCTKFGFEEYLSPLTESVDVYRAKSGEDVGGKELITFEDKAGRELALRPEMTPSVTRMVTRIYESTAKPIKYFSIANFMRNEKPQRGRNREFWQLNADIFGEESINADVEVLQLGLELMLAFNPPKGSFIVLVNNRKIIDNLLDIAEISTKKQQDVVRLLDKWEKLSEEDFVRKLSELGISDDQSQKLKDFMTCDNKEKLVEMFPSIAESEGFQELHLIMETLINLGYKDWISFQPNVIRGFDYYTGIVFEVFDNNTENNRSMFGGGRYNGLADIFGSQDVPATGFAPGDETTKLFLESWGLFENLENNVQSTYYLPILDENLLEDCMKLANTIRANGNNVFLGLGEQRFLDAVKYAEKKGYPKMVILGDNELKAGKYKLRDISTREEEEINLD